MFTSARIRRAAAGLAAVSLCSCAVGPNFRRPAPPKTETYEPAGAAVGSARDLRFIYGVAPDARWWRVYGSNRLDELVEAGLRESPNLDAARAVLRESRDQLKAGAGVFYPTVGSGFAAENERITTAFLGRPNQSSTFNFFSLDGTITYALDLFGGERRSVEALKAQSEHQRHALGAARLALTGAIVDVAVARAAYEAEADVLADVVAQDRLQHHVVSAGRNAGTTAESAVLQAMEQLVADEQSLADARARASEAEHLLKALVGREPGERLPVDPPRFDALSTPREVPVSLPSQLVSQRPDILEAEADLHQASANVGVATAALFPSVTLSGTRGLENNLLAQLTSAQSQFWNYGVAVNTPLFQGGRLWFQRKAAQAAYRAALANYRQTVLNALQQTADGLQALSAEHSETAAAQSGLQAGTTAHALARVNVQAGLNSDYDASAFALAVDRLKITWIAARATELQGAAALYLASGGGWPGQTARTQALGAHADPP